MICREDMVDMQGRYSDCREDIVDMQGRYSGYVRKI